MWSFHFSGRRPVLLATASGLLLALAGPLRATWSIVVANRATGEIGVAQATCIVGPDLQKSLAVVVPGKGGGAVQAWWDDDGTRRRVIWDGLKEGKLPRDILQDLRNLGGHL